MATDIRLPVEILTAVLKEVNVQDLWNVRIASRTLCAVVNPIVFRVLSVTSRESAQKLGRLIDIPNIALHVREVYYESKWERELEKVGTKTTPESACSFSKLASRIHQLPRLETINLWFYSVYRVPANSDSGGRPSLQASILAALAASFSVRAPAELTSLNLEHLLVSDFPPLGSAPFLTLLTPALRRLRLFVFNDIASDDARSCNFWGNFFPRMILAPVQHSLTDLYIVNDRCIGSSSELSFAGLYFPHLCALTLFNFFWEPFVGIEPFILRHATTLARLGLFFCGLPVPRLRLLSPSPSTAEAEADVLSTRWEHIWDHFEAELTTALVALRVDIIFYATSQSNEGVRAICVGEKRKAADDAAVRRFRTSVAARSKEMRRKY